MLMPQIVVTGDIKSSAQHTHSTQHRIRANKQFAHKRHIRVLNGKQKLFMTLLERQKQREKNNEIAFVVDLQNTNCKKEMRASGHCTLPTKFRWKTK